jgi:uridine kinase
LLAVPLSPGRRIVAIDGMEGAGKTTYADRLARSITGVAVVRASIDGFHHPRAVRYRLGRDSPEGCYRDSYDYAMFRRLLIDPFRAGESFALAAFDHSTDAAVPVDWRSAPADALLIVDGVFLNRPELRALWDYSVYLDVDRATAERRMLERDGASEPTVRYSDAQQLYQREADPAGAASVVVDNR